MKMKQLKKDFEALGLIEMGAVSRITGGSPYFFPWYELGVPPFIYTCPYC